MHQTIIHAVPSKQLNNGHFLLPVLIESQSPREPNQDNPDHRRTEISLSMDVIVQGNDVIIMIELIELCLVGG